MKTSTYYILLALVVLLCSIETTDACSLNPTAVITTDPDGTVFYNGDPVLLSGENSTANCGSINQYRWRVRPVGGSYTTVYQGSSPTYNYTFPLLQDGESEKSYDIELRVRNSSGLFGYAYKSVTVKHSHDSYYYLTDHLGSVRVTVNERGDPMGWDDYYPFGLQMPGRSQQQYGSPLTDVKYTGYELNQEGGLGLYHAGARLYDPAVGRFMQQDPHSGNYPGWSSFHYAANNPLIITDPTGKDWYLNLASGRVVWYDGSDDRFDQGYINLGTLDGQDDTTIDIITEQLDELGYDYAFTVDDGLTVDTKSQYQGWIMMQIFSPEHVGTALALGTLGTLGTSTYSGIRSSPNIIHDGIKSTTHGTNRIAGATATRGGVLSRSEIAITNKVGRTFTQADGAIVKVHEVGGRYNVTVTGDKGLITTFKNLSPKSLEKLSRNYGWK